MSVSGSKARNMGLVNCTSPMAVRIAVTLSMVLQEAKADFYIPMEMFISANGKMIKLTELGLITLSMAESIKANGSLT